MIEPAKQNCPPVADVSIGERSAQSQPCVPWSHSRRGRGPRGQRACAMQTWMCCAPLRLPGEDQSLADSALLATLIGEMGRWPGGRRETGAHSARRPPRLQVAESPSRAGGASIPRPRRHLPTMLPQPSPDVTGVGPPTCLLFRSYTQTFCRLWGPLCIGQVCAC